MDRGLQVRDASMVRAKSGGDDADFGGSAVSHVSQDGLNSRRENSFNALQGSLGRQHTLSLANHSVLVQCPCFCTTWITKSRSAQAGAGLMTRTVSMVWYFKHHTLYRNGERML